MRGRFKAPSPALVISLVALFVALGGSSYAAIATLPVNSVGTKQLKNDAVIGTKIKDASVTAADIDPTGLTAPEATHAGSADSATNATHATSADSATTATSAANAAYAASAAQATNASYASTAGSATIAGQATNATTAANGIFTTRTFVGSASTVQGNATAYVWVGNPSSVTTTASQTLVGVGEVPLGSTKGTSFALGLCYQPSAGGTIRNFAGANFTLAQAPAGSSNLPYTAAFAIAPGAGDWSVGLCVRNSGANPLDSNGFVNGWVQVVGGA